MAMKTVNVHQAKRRLSRLLEQVAAGEEVVIAKTGKPVARIVPISPREPRRPGLAKGRLTDAFFEPLPEDELAAWGQ
jgi:prevent-host-death family protein